MGIIRTNDGVGVSESHPLPVQLTGRSAINVGGYADLTVDATAGGKALPSIPATANGAVITVEDAEARVTWDGTAPTATLGSLVYVSDQIRITNRADLLAFRAIRTGATSSTFRITYVS